MDLKTSYLGLALEHPVVASASPISKNLDGIKRLEDSGASAIVMHSLFEEQIRMENEALDFFGGQGSGSFAEISSFFPKAGDYRVGPDEYLDLVRCARETVRVPVIASLNGFTEGGWTDYAAELEKAGASAIELNVFWVASDMALDGRAVEDRYVRVVESVRRAVKIPLAVKLSPYFSSLGAFAQRLTLAGADGLVLFNRFYQPDIDLEKLEIVPDLKFSTPIEIRQALLWIGVLRGKLSASLAASSGVHSAIEAIKYLLVGADAVMTTSSLLQNGPPHLQVILRGLREWGEERGYESVSQMRGSMSQGKVANPSSFERANYVKILQGYKGPWAR